MRVSERMRYDKAATRIDSAKTNNADVLNVLTTQKRINKISDDPLGSARVIRERSRMSELKQLEKNIEFSKGYLERAESAVSGIHENLIRAKELSIALANSTYGADSREAAAREVSELIKNVISLANTSYAGRYVFSGFRTETPAIDENGNYVGDDGQIYLQIDPSTHQPINIQARNLFDPTPIEQERKHVGLVNTLNLLYEGLMKSDKSQVFKAMDELDFNLEKTSSYQATIGARSKALEVAQNRIADMGDHAEETVSQIEDADIFKASSDFKKTETVLQSTLMASNKLLQPSLLNFMQ
jgi:flagellar hook-associated protein 3 FlgL